MSQNELEIIGLVSGKRCVGDHPCRDAALAGDVAADLEFRTHLAALLFDLLERRPQTLDLGAEMAVPSAKLFTAAWWLALTPTSMENIQQPLVNQTGCGRLVDARIVGWLTPVADVVGLPFV
jgi:hypothetical protein